MTASKTGSEPSGSKPKDQKKRKPSTTTSGNDLGPQKTLHGLFGNSKQNSESSPNKRLKLSQSTPGIDNTRAVPKIKYPGEMYNLDSTNTRARDDGGSTCTIDLTNSVPSSPHKYSPNRNKATGIRSAKSRPYTGPRNLVVKNLRETSRTDPNQYYDQVWAQLDAALSAIFRNEKIPCSKEELYRGVETLCRQDRAPPLYGKLWAKCREEIWRWLKEPLMKEALQAKDADTLQVVVEAWSRWSTHLTTIRSIFFYLDRSYLLHSSQPSIEDMGIAEFRNNVFSDEALNPKILQGACDLLRDARQGNGLCSHNELFQEAVKMFHVLAVYSKEFEPKLMGESQGFFICWGQEKAELPLEEYVRGCQKLINLETERCTFFGLDSTTSRGLERYIEDILVEQRQTKLLDIEAVSTLLERNVVDALRLVFSLLKRKGLIEKLKPCFEAFITKQGADIVFDEAREQEMVVRLLEFKGRLDYVLEHAFQMHEGLGHTLREAFESFINKTRRSNMTWGTDNPKPGEMIAKYVDMILKGGVKAIPAAFASGDLKKARNEDDSSEDEDEEIAKQLDHVLDLFRFVHGKAVFEAFYKRDLARRLLLQRSASADAEKSMLTRLKSECGSGFTHNLEQMFKDIELAREEITSYKSMLEASQSQSPIDLNVNVLSASAWPSYPDVAVEIPKNIQKALAGFEDHYKLKHSGRRLAWKHSLAHCQLKAKFPRGNKEIVVSSFQAVVLLLFNGKKDSEPVPYREIQGATSLDDDELKRTLQSLACANQRVLTKTPKGKDVNDTDTFTVNMNFHDAKYRIKINQIQAKETKAENKETHERVAADRNYETQAAIVRIMKTRKTITHAELVSEVIVATKSRGVLDPSDIKKNIEKYVFRRIATEPANRIRLIEKDYMERDESKEGRNAYSYLA
ncbi:hypothetical protein MMC07_007488 [Pseudocyphellaria aurata]|nr:hypothetical protein [Pseudocyphellaria aurata]